jgi:alpha-galactosidase
MKRLKIVLIGAGSASFGRGAIADILSSEELGEFNLEVALVDIDPRALDRMERLARILKEHWHSSARITATTDRATLLPGAAYVIVSVAVNRWHLWEKDFYIPAAYGFRHVNGENGGPGGAFHTLRSLNLVIPICRDMERLCPDALLINYTNPESRVCLGIRTLTTIRAVGLCHGSFATLRAVCRVLGRPPEGIELTLAGLNHFHWALGIAEAGTGADLMPEFNRRMGEADWGLDPLTRTLYELFGYLTYPAGSHPGEYLALAHEVQGPDFLNWGIGPVSRAPRDTAADRTYSIESEPGRASYELWSLDQARLIESVADGKAPLTQEMAQPTTELAIPIICDIECDRKRRELSVNVPNESGAISNLPSDALVEVPAMVDADGIHAVSVGPLPEAIAGLCRLQVSIQNLVVEAFRQGSKRLLLQALVIDPVVDSADRARKMMEHMLKVEAEYLPQLR